MSSTGGSTVDLSLYVKRDGTTSIADGQEFEGDIYFTHATGGALYDCTGMYDSLGDKTLNIYMAEISIMSLIADSVKFFSCNLNMDGNNIIAVADPRAGENQDAATKVYADTH